MDIRMFCLMLYFRFLNHLVDIDRRVFASANTEIIDTVIQSVYTLPFVLRNPVFISEKSENANGFSRTIRQKVEVSSCSSGSIDIQVLVQSIQSTISCGIINSLRILIFFCLIFSSRWRSNIVVEEFAYAKFVWNFKAKTTIGLRRVSLKVRRMYLIPLIQNISN